MFSSSQISMYQRVVHAMQQNPYANLPEEKRTLLQNFFKKNLGEFFKKGALKTLEAGFLKSTKTYMGGRAMSQARAHADKFAAGEFGKKGENKLVQDKVELAISYWQKNHLEKLTTGINQLEIDYWEVQRRDSKNPREISASYDLQVKLVKKRERAFLQTKKAVAKALKTKAAPPEKSLDELLAFIESDSKEGSKGKEKKKAKKSKVQVKLAKKKKAIPTSLQTSSPNSQEEAKHSQDMQAKEAVGAPTHCFDQLSEATGRCKLDLQPRITRWQRVKSWGDARLFTDNRKKEVVKLYEKLDLKALQVQVEHHYIPGIRELLHKKAEGLYFFPTPRGVGLFAELQTTREVGGKVFGIIYLGIDREKKEIFHCKFDPLGEKACLYDHVIARAEELLSNVKPLESGKDDGWELAGTFSLEKKEADVVQLSFGGMFTHKYRIAPLTE